MVLSQFRARRKSSGGKYVAFRKKRLCDNGGEPALTEMGAKRVKIKRVKGDNQKKALLSNDTICVSKDGKVSKLKILTVKANPANINYQRRNIITKGAIIKTEKGDVKVTSRPGQSGELFGVFVNN